MLHLNTAMPVTTLSLNDRHCQCVHKGDPIICCLQNTIYMEKQSHHEVQCLEK